MNWWRKFRCRTLGWHGQYIYDYPTQGINTYAACGHCGFHGLFDSQGNLF